MCLPRLAAATILRQRAGLLMPPRNRHSRPLGGISLLRQLAGWVPRRLNLRRQKTFKAGHGMGRHSPGHEVKKLAEVGETPLATGRKIAPSYAMCTLRRTSSPSIEGTIREPAWDFLEPARCILPSWHLSKNLLRLNCVKYDCELITHGLSGGLAGTIFLTTKYAGLENIRRN